jgi:hypothetical protein
MDRGAFFKKRLEQLAPGGGEKLPIEKFKRKNRGLRPVRYARYWRYSALSLAQLHAGAEAGDGTLCLIQALGPEIGTAREA